MEIGILVECAYFKAISCANIQSLASVVVEGVDGATILGGLLVQKSVNRACIENQIRHNTRVNWRGG
jgi:hypothetical protein